MIIPYYYHIISHDTYHMYRNTAPGSLGFCGHRSWPRPQLWPKPGIFDERNGDNPLIILIWYYNPIIFVLILSIVLYTYLGFLYRKYGKIMLVLDEDWVQPQLESYKITHKWLPGWFGLSLGVPHWLIHKSNTYGKPQTYMYVCIYIFIAPGWLVLKHDICHIPPLKKQVQAIIPFFPYQSLFSAVTVALLGAVNSPQNIQCNWDRRLENRESILKFSDNNVCWFIPLCLLVYQIKIHNFQLPCWLVSPVVFGSILNQGATTSHIFTIYIHVPSGHQGWKIKT